tara:strand:- start:127 stop:231 length:105 start_codon:yes stop_codon:yes gene_type:complete
MEIALGDWTVPRQHCCFNNGLPMDLNHNQSRWRL